MKKLLFIFFAMFIIGNVFSQTVDILANPGTSVTPALGNSRYVANESIYTETEIGASNFTTVGTAINKFSVFVNTLGTPTTFNNVTIWMKDVPLATTTFTTGTYTTAGYTQVYSGPVVASAIGIASVNLTTPYVRATGTNLQVLIERTDNVLHTGYVWNTANGNHTGASVNSCRRYNGTTALSGTTSLAISAFRARIQLKHEYPNDASVIEVYTLGKLPIPNSTPHTVSANIKNDGANTLTALPVTLNVTGANSHTDVQNIASLAPGASTTVTFTSYTPTVAGADNISITVPADDFLGNNSKIVNQSVNINTWSYAYGTTPSGGVGFNGATGDFVAKFNTNVAAALAQISVNFSAGGQTYKLGIWDATGAGGTPGNLLFETTNQTSATGVNVIPISPAVAIPSGNFYVGVRQIGTVNVSFSYQTETPIRSSTFYFVSPSGGTTWTDFAPNNSFRFMIEPKLQLPIDANVSNLVLPYTTITCNGNAETITTVLTNTGSNPILPGTASLTLKMGGANSNTATATNATSIASGATEVISFTGLNLSNGGTNFDTVYVVLPGDLEPLNDTIKTSHLTSATISTFPSEENVDGASLVTFKYVSTLATSQNWSVRTGNYSNPDQTQPLVPHSGTKFMLYDSYNAASGASARFFSDCFAIPATGCSYQVNFWMSHDNTTSLPELDSMYVSVTTNKGLTWVRLPIVGGGPGLQRHDPTLTANAAPVWQLHSVDLSAYAGQTIQIGFEGVSKFGNAFGLDDITVSSVAAANVALNNTVNTFTLTQDCDDMGWTYYKDASNKNVLAVEWGTNSASKAAATASITLDASDFSVTSGSGATAMGTFTMKRIWNIDVAGVQPTTPVNIRFFYDATEKQATENAAIAFQASNAGSVLKTPIWFKTNSGNFVGDASHVTEVRVVNSAPLTDVNVAGNKINGVLYAQFNGITSFSGGTFASGVGLGSVLPISVNHLRGTKLGATHNLNWKVTCTSSPTATMILERSGDNRRFTAINNITADAVRCAQPFDYVDASPLVGLNYYRLKIIDANGKVTYSNTIAMANTKTGVTIVGIAPNPVTSTGNATLNVASAQKGMLRLVVTDITGRQVAVESAAIIAGSNQIPINVAKLAAGSYNITAITDDGNKTTVRFVKQ